MANNLKFYDDTQTHSISLNIPTPTGTDVVTMPSSGTVGALESTQFGFKNYIINGNFDVWQYGTSQTGSGYGSDDRWLNANVGSTKTHSRVACTDTERALFNATYFSRTVVTSVAGAGNVVTKTQHIEDVTKLAGKTITISFWAKADGNKNIQLALAQSFGTGGTPSSKSFVQMPIVALTSTWQKKTITVTIPSIVGKTLGTDGIHTSSTQIYLVFDAGINWLSTVTIGQQSGTFDIAQVQIEEGSVATPFEQRPYGLELSLCQRYFRYLYPRFLGYVLGGGEAYMDISFGTMRIMPTATPTGSAVNVINTSATNWSIENKSHSNVHVYVIATSSARTGFEQTLSLSAEL